MGVHEQTKKSTCLLSLDQNDILANAMESCMHKINILIYLICQLNKCMVHWHHLWILPTQQYRSRQSLVTAVMCRLRGINVWCVGIICGSFQHNNTDQGKAWSLLSCVVSVQTDSIREHHLSVSSTFFLPFNRAYGSWFVKRICLKTFHSIILTHVFHLHLL